jgi:hypothetical protein
MNSDSQSRRSQLKIELRDWRRFWKREKQSFLEDNFFREGRSMSSAEGAFDGVWWLGACCEIGFSSFLLVLVLEVGHSLIPSSRTRNSSGSKRSTKRVKIATIRANSSLPGQIRSLFVIRLATEASKHAAHSKAEPRASSKYLALWGPWRFPFPSAVLSRTDMDALSS